jgi:putative ABC transport system permease protein
MPLNLRPFRRSPGFSALVVVMLTLGAGTDALMFSVINSVLFRPLPYPDGNRLVQVNSVMSNGEQAPVSWLNYEDIRKQSASFSNAAAYVVQSSVLQSGNGASARVVAVRATANLLPMLGVQPRLGRLFSAADDRPDQPCAVVLGSDVWSTQFSSDPLVTSRSVRVDNHACSVAGVMPQGFVFPDGSDAGIWMVLRPDITSRGTGYLTVIARLTPSASLAQARAETSVVGSRLAAAYPKENGGLSIGVRSYRDVVTGDISTALWALLGAVILLQVIICANVGNMQLVRAISRRREIAIRMALGARKRHIAWQLLGENLVLAGIAGVAGLGLAYGALHLLRNLAVNVLPRVQEIELDLVVCLALFATVVLVAVIAALFPLYQAREDQVEPVLRENAGSVTGGRGQAWVRDVLVIGQLALAVMLLFGSALLLHSLYRLLGQDLGFTSTGVVTMRTSVSGENYAGSNLAAALYLPQLDRVRNVPGVRSAALVTFLPLSPGHISAAFKIVGRPDVDPEHPSKAALNAATEDYFAVMGIPLIKGRVFTASDDLGTQRVAVINDALARRYFADDDPIGKQITFGDPDFVKHPLNVIGVVRGSRQQALGEPPEPEIYFAVRQVPPASLWSQILLRNIITYVARTDGDPAGLINTVRGAITSVDASTTLFDVRTMDEVVSNVVQDRRLGLVLLAAFASLALVVAAIGLYAMLSYNVQQRRAEIALRLLLGAPRTNVFRLIAGRAVTIDLIGIGIGIAGAFTVGRLISHLLYGIQPWDPLTLAAACFVLMLITLPAAFIPAMRASSVNMLKALRSA